MRTLFACPTAFARSVRSIIIIALPALAACTPADYADGITSFSQAVSQANTTEQALIAADQQVKLDQWIAAGVTAKANVVFVNWPKCQAPAGPYHAGDCAVTLGGAPAPVATAPSLSGLAKYAAVLGTVIADKSCASLQSDTQSLATTIGDIAKDTKDKSLATDASPYTKRFRAWMAAAISRISSSNKPQVLGLVSMTAATSPPNLLFSVGCYLIQTKQVEILRAATKDANPIIQNLIKQISITDSALQQDAINATVIQLLTHTAPGYETSKTAANLKTVLALSQSLDQAQSAPIGPVLAKLGTLHQTLTDDLQSPTINLKRVENDAQSFITSAQAVATAAKALATPAPTPAPAAKAK